MYYSLKYNKYLRTIFSFQVPKTIRNKLKSYSSISRISLNALVRLMVQQLFAIVGADYCFTYIDAGRNDRGSDIKVFREVLNISIKNNLRGDGFPLRTDLMKEFGRHGLSDEENILNYRLPRARRFSGNTFGKLT